VLITVIVAVRLGLVNTDFKMYHSKI